MTGRCPTAASTSRMSARPARRVIGRAFMVDNDPGAGGRGGQGAASGSTRTRPERSGTAVASFLAGRAPLAGAPEAGETTFVDAVHLEINTIPPNDFSYWETIDELVQQEPAGAGDPEILGQLAAVGIRKGEPFAPDERMREILEEAVAVGNATARTLCYRAARVGGHGLLPGLRVVQHAVRRRLRVPDAAARDHRRGRPAEPERRRTQAQRAHRLLLSGDRDHAGDVHAAHRHRVAVPHGHRATPTASTSTAPAATGSTCRPTFPRAASGR